MKKWLTGLLLVSFAVGTAVAEEPSPWWKLGRGKEDEAVGQQVPQRMQRKRPQLSEGQRAKMKAHFEAVKKMADAVRSEPDPVKKAQLTADLRAKLNESADLMQAEFEKRIEKAEADILKMKARLAEGEKNKEKRIDEQLRKLLSGENPFRGGGDQPHRKGPPAE